MRTHRIPLLVLFPFFLASVCVAQIPNPGFESWTLTVPDGWVTSNAPPVYTNVTKSSTAHTGLAAIRGDVVQVAAVAMSATIQSGPGGHGFAYAQRPAAVNGWYQFNSVGGDRFGVNVVLYKGGETGTVVANAASADPTTRGSYTQFSVPFQYFTPDVPDLCIMQFSVALPFGGTVVHVGSYFLIDDLSMGNLVGVAPPKELPLEYRLEQNYPNPFNPTTDVSYQLSAPSEVRLVVYDMLGQEVAVLVNEKQNAGMHQVTFNATGLASGMYFYRLNAGAYVASRSMLLVK